MIRTSRLRTDDDLLTRYDDDEFILVALRPVNGAGKQSGGSDVPADGAGNYVTVGTRWTDAGGTSSASTTNTLGGAGGVVTWSIAGAGLTNATGQNFFTGSSVALSSFLAFDYVATLRAIFAAWSAVANIEFVQVPDEGGNAGTPTYPTIRIFGGNIDGNGNIAGRAFYPFSGGSGGDVVFDSTETSLWNANSLFLLGLHEVGHALGLDHSTIQNTIMYPVVNLGLAGLQADDIAGIRAVYGTQDVVGTGTYYMPASQTNMTVTFGLTNLTIVGNALGNTIVGSSANETFRGGGNNDTINGGAGSDTAVYSGAEANYRFIRLTDGHIRVVDLRGGSPDGTDNLAGIEKFQFSDGLKSVAQVIDITDFAFVWSNSANNDTRYWAFSNGTLGTSVALGAPASTWHVRATGDFNGDGITDLIWHDTASGALRNWQMSTSGLSVNINLGGVPAGWRILGTGDFNADGTSDVIWQNTSTGELREWIMADGVLSSNVALGGLPTNWRLVGTGDFTGDGATDMLWRNTTSGEIRELKMVNGTINQVSILGTLGASWGTAATGDFNGDGTTDMVWRNTANGDTRVWLMSNGALASNIVLPGPAPIWKVIGAGDFNQDGTDDLLWQNTSTGELRDWTLSNGQIASNISIAGPPPANWHPAVNPAMHSDFIAVI